MIVWARHIAAKKMIKVEERNTEAMGYERFSLPH